MRDLISEKLWPMTAEDNIAISWFCVIKAVFQINDVSKFTENDIFTVQDYLEVSIYYYVERKVFFNYFADGKLVSERHGLYCILTHAALTNQFACKHYPIP